MDKGEDIIRIDCGASLQHPGEPSYSLVDLSEDEIRDLSIGVVPRVIQANALGCLAWRDEDERRAQRPVKPGRRSVPRR